MPDTPLLVIVGPTAVGKTGLSLRLARDFAVEIISADSRQIYRGLDIGTAKPTSQEQKIAPHHLIDIADPDDVLTLAEFQARTFTMIDSIFHRRHLPLLVGGTGQWIWSVVEGWHIPPVPPDQAFRAELEKLANREGSKALHAQLAEVDPLAAQKIDPRNVRRVIRALEVFEKTGIPISQHQRKATPPFHTLLIGLTMSRPLLYERIDRRVDKMMELGLLEEVKRLVRAGVSWDSPALTGLGYRQLCFYLRNELSLEDAIALIKKETRRFVRLQYNWFQANDRRIQWFDIGSGLSEEYRQIVELIRSR
jgi:tRNA dimethylallyltransferase